MLNLVAATLWTVMGVGLMVVQPEVSAPVIAGLCCFTLAQVHLKGE